MEYRGAMSMSDFDTWTNVSCTGIGCGEFFGQQPRRSEVDWCHNYESPGKFAFGGNSVWFSIEKDAIIFALMWTR
jgi:hypothetical protein